MDRWNAPERARTLIFSTRDRAVAFKRTLTPHNVRGKVSVRKTKGWNTYSVAFKPCAYSDTVAIMALYTPEYPHYRDIISDLDNN